MGVVFRQENKQFVVWCFLQKKKEAMVVVAFTGKGAVAKVCSPTRRVMVVVSSPTQRVMDVVFFPSKRRDGCGVSRSRGLTIAVLQKKRSRCRGVFDN